MQRYKAGNIASMNSSAKLNQVASGQDISGPTASYYGDKERRFPYHTDDADKTEELSEDDANKKLFEKTGLCDEAFDLKAFLESMLKDNQIAQTGSPYTLLKDVKGYSPDLYKAFSGYTNVSAQAYANYEWRPTLSNSDRTLTADLYLSSVLTHDDKLILKLDASSAYTWLSIQNGNLEDKPRCATGA